MPSYVAFGNHDGLVQGNAFATRAYEDVGTGCVKPTAPAFNPFDPQSALDPGYLGGLFGSDPGKVGLVPRDPDRRYVDHRQFKELFKAGQGDAPRIRLRGGRRERRHRRRMPATTRGRRARASASSRWTRSPRAACPARRPRATSTTRSSGGSSASWPPPRRPTSSRSCSATTPSAASTHRSTDEQAGPCTGDDGHGHGTNPGCDRDPRNSSPVHLGADLQALLLKHPHVIATVFGHTHENKVTPFPRAGRRRVLGHREPLAHRLAAAEQAARGDGQPRRHAVDIRHGPRRGRAGQGARARHRRGRLRRARSWRRWPAPSPTTTRRRAGWRPATARGTASAPTATWS